MSRRAERVDDGPDDPLAGTSGGDGGMIALSLVLALIISSPVTLSSLRGVTEPATAMTAFVVALAAVWALAAAAVWSADVLGRVASSTRARRGPHRGVEPGTPGTGRVDPC